MFTITEKQQKLLKVQLSKTVREGNGGNIEYVTDIIKLFSKLSQKLLSCMAFHDFRS